MTRYQSASRLKDLAKDKLSGYYTNAILLLLLAGMLSASVSTTVEQIFPASGNLSLVISSLLVLCFSIFTGVLNIGVRYGYFRIFCGERPTIADLFYGYNNNSKDFLILSGIDSTLNYLASVPIQFFAIYYIRTQNTLFLSLILASIVINLALMFLVAIPLSQSVYLLIDFPELTTKEAIAKSISIMKGNKGRYLGLLISFLPVLFLGVLTLGVGFIWISPYIQMTMTCFYLDLVSPEMQN